MVKNDVKVGKEFDLGIDKYDLWVLLFEFGW